MEQQKRRSDGVGNLVAAAQMSVNPCSGESGDNAQVDQQKRYSDGVDNPATVFQMSLYMVVSPEITHK